MKNRVTVDVSKIDRSMPFRRDVDYSAEIDGEMAVASVVAYGLDESLRLNIHIQRDNPVTISVNPDFLCYPSISVESDRAQYVLMGLSREWQEIIKDDAILVSFGEQGIVEWNITLHQNLMRLTVAGEYLQKKLKEMRHEVV